MALQADGKIVAVGSTDAGTVDFALARYNPNGSLDTSFSGDGKQTTDFGGRRRRRAAVALQADGKIVVVGAVGGQDRATSRSPATTRTARSTRASPATASRRPTSAARRRRTAWRSRPTARSSSVGTGVDGIDGDFALARYNPNGSLDTSFSGDGKQTTDFGRLRRPANGVALQADGKIVVAGPRRRQRRDFALARYNADGTLDTSFSGDGKQTTDFGGSDDAGDGVALQADGKIVAVGGADAAPAATTSPSPATTPTARSTRASPATASRRPTSVRGRRRGERRGDPGERQDRRGRPRDGGATGSDFALARYNPDGSLDTTFSGDGKRTTNFGGDDAANGVALQADGKIVAVGRGLGLDGTSDFALARYLGS